jgi:acyl-CoA synthetase (AMP-forming)/AMP-acid ligase II
MVEVIADIEFCLTPYAQAPQPLIAAISRLTTLAVHDNGSVMALSGSPTATVEVDRVPTEVSDASTAYILFTSGSTGRPKGCMVPHRGSALYAHAVVESCGLDSSMTFLLKTPYVFDVSIQDIYSAFAAGGKLVIADPGLHKDADGLATFIADHGINCLGFTPTLLVEFVNHLASDDVARAAVASSLQRVLTIGEALMTATCRQLFALCPKLDGELHNLYGPTEASVGVSHFRVSSTVLGEDVVVPIGQPFPYVLFRIFSPSHYETKAITPESLVETGDGEVGELFIGGDCLAQGYVNDAQKTSTAFFDYPEVMKRPVGAASRFSLYKSGDLVRRRADGVFMILGRTDHQVKIGGVRIECEEISAVLKTHDSVDDALVTVFEGPLGKSLAAYVVMQEPNKSFPTEDDLKAKISEASTDAGTDIEKNTSVGSSIGCEEKWNSDAAAATCEGSREKDQPKEGIVWCNEVLKDWVAQSSLLPAMRPKIYIRLDAFPKNTAGKIDRGALPSALEAFEQLAGSGDCLIVPATDDEEKMAKCWKHALKRNEISVETAFLTYGGHSLTALALRSEISRNFGIYLPAALFADEKCTVRWLLEEMKKFDKKAQQEVHPKVVARLPFLVERTISTFFHMDGVEPHMYVAAHKFVPLVPATSLRPAFFYFVPCVEIELEHPVNDLFGLAAKLIQAHPILRSRYSYKRELIIPAEESSPTDVGIYCSWDAPVNPLRLAIMKMYECPLFHIIGYRKPNHSEGPAVSITVLWHHLISDAHSDDIVKRDINMLASGASLNPANLSAYAACSQHSLAKPTLSEKVRGRWCDEPKFALPLKPRCDITNISGRVVHTLCVSVAVSRRVFDQDTDKARFFLDHFCSATGQFRGRLGLLTNARSKVDEDASSLIGALIYSEEYAYDWDSSTLEPLGRATDPNSCLVINVQNSYRDLPAEEIIARLGYDHCDRVVAGDPAFSIRQRAMSGGLGINFGAGESLYVECMAVRDATIFLTMYPDTMFDGLDTIRFLQQYLAA